MKTVISTQINIPADVIQDFIDTIGQSIEALESLLVTEHKLRVFAGLSETLKGFLGNGADAIKAQQIRDTLRLPNGRHMTDQAIRSALARLREDFDLAVDLLDIEFPLQVSYTSDVIGQQPIDGQELAQEQGKPAVVPERGKGDDIPF